MTKTQTTTIKEVTDEVGAAWEIVRQARNMGRSHCADVSVALADRLTAAGFDARPVIVEVETHVIKASNNSARIAECTYSAGMRRFGNTKPPHVVVMIGDDIVIDPTFDQFGISQTPGNNVPLTYWGPFNELPSLADFDADFSTVAENRPDLTIDPDFVYSTGGDWGSAIAYYKICDAYVSSGYGDIQRLIDMAMAGSMVKKVGRNDACPCGSKRKFKKCCLVVR